MNSVVIGAASGMGAAVAERLAKLGSVVRADLRGADVVCDVTNDEQVRALVQPADALVITAGLSPTMGDGRRIFDVNLVGTARVVDAFARVMRPGGMIVCFASIAGHMASPDEATRAALEEPLHPDFFDRVSTDDPGTAYSLSKWGVLRLVRREAARLGQQGVRIVSISPGIIDTPMGQREATAQPVMAEMSAALPLQRDGQADEVAAVAAFLVSPEASYITGTDIAVDGGFTSLLG